MKAYWETLERDINKVLEQSHVCRGEWCRVLESEIDALQYELMVARKCAVGLEKARFDEMSGKLKDACRHLERDIYI